MGKFKGNSLEVKVTGNSKLQSLNKQGPTVVYFVLISSQERRRNDLHSLDMDTLEWSDRYLQ